MGVKELMSMYNLGCSVFGTFPIRKYYMPSLIYCVIFFISTTSFSILCCVNIILSDTTLREKILTIAYKLLNYAFYFSSVHLITNFKDFENMLDTLQHSEVYLSKYGINIIYKKSPTLVIVIRCILEVSSFIIRLVIAIDDSDTNNAQFIVSSFIENFNCLASALYLYSLYFYIKELSRMLTLQLEQKLETYPYEGFYDQIKAILKVQSRIVQISLKLEKIFWSFTLFFVFSHFIQLTLDLSEFIWSFKDNMNLEHYASCLGQTAYLFTELFTTVHACEQLRNKVDDFTDALLDGIMRDKTGHIYKKPELHSFIESRPALEFTAHGMFKLDYALIISILGAVFSFNVILYQSHGSVE